MDFDWVWLLIRFIVAVIILTFVLVTMGFLTYFERKVAAHMQHRMGPNRTGPIGLLQWVADAVKLISKEEIVPAGADKVIFWLAPVAPLTLVGLFVCGLGVANFFPFAYTAALENALDHTDIATARLSLTGGSAVLLLPLTLGLLADATGIYAAFAIVLPLLLTGVVTVVLSERRSVTAPARG